MKKIIKRILLILPAVFLQIMFYLAILSWFEKFIPIITAILSILSFFVMLYIVTKRDEANYKMLWLIIILIMPIFGTILYLLFGEKNTCKKLKNKLEKSSKDINFEFNITNNLNNIKNEDFRLYQTLNRVSKLSKFPVCNNSSKYYKFGEEMFEDMKIELQKAKKFIFIEYFIIQRGEFFDSIVKILKQKVKEGVDVRILYDDIGSLTTHTFKETGELVKSGIKCGVFNPLFLLSGKLNNRDHRKMMIIDGSVAFSGGINIADEYVNKYEKYGIWKDIGFKIEGEAVTSYTYMFVEFWNAFSIEKIDSKILSESNNTNSNDGYILSYYDSPSNDNHISYELYIDLLAQATDYVWFYTPYLILGDSLQNALINAAQRGVDVRIILPGIPDKKVPYRMAKSFYKGLLENRIKIYEYTPGFVHAKACIVDDKVCTIGTVNLDYRSLFLHYECNSIFYKSNIITELKLDFLNTQDKCKVVTRENINTKFLHTIGDSILRIFSPLC